MASLWEKQQARKAAREAGAKGPQSKPPSVPAANLVEPPMPVIPAAPAVPVIAHVAAPEPEAPVSVAVPPSVPAVPVPAAAPAPVAVAKPPPVPSVPVAASPAPEETSSGSIPVRTGEYEVVGEAPVPAPAPAPAAAPALSTFLPEEATPEPAALPSEALAAPAKAKAPAELKRKASGTLGFKQLSDNGHLPSKYKLTYTGQAGATACNFLLIGKDTQQVTLELNEPKTLTVQTKGGPMTVTLTYKGASKTDGAKEVDYVVEGGVSAVTGVLEKFRGVGPFALSAWRSFVKHLPEEIALGFAAGLAVCGLTMDWVATQLGRLHPYVTMAVPALMAGLAIWTYAERSKDIRRESEKAE